MHEEASYMIALPECMSRNSTTPCREINISAQVPLSWALPLYGYIMPIIVAVTIATNSFIVLVLSHRYLRTPTNYVLLAMAVTELLTGLSCLPWLLYYYTFEGYIIDAREGLPPFWCTMFPYMASVMPSIFHTAAIWLTVYLAVQRYIYICLPKLVRSHCTARRSKQVIMVICIASLWIYAPEFFVTYNGTYEIFNSRHNRTRKACFRHMSEFIQSVGHNVYYYTIYGLYTLFSHTLPCILLVCFTWRLIAAIRQADKRHAHLIAKQAKRKFTASEISSSSGNGNVELSTRFIRGSKMRSSIGESKRIQSLKQNTRMLIVVIILFLITEIPAAAIFSLHVSTIALRITFIQQHYALLNKLLILRNVLIVLSYPFRFAIYCGMSQQFREVVKQMLTQRVFFPCEEKAKTLMEQSTKYRLNHNDTLTTDDKLKVENSDTHMEHWLKARNSLLSDRLPSSHKDSIARESLISSSTLELFSARRASNFSNRS
uniref:G-protein coupled receptors family 1 profile domain-containing protein n=1 Tax=Acrobeloides nanus TaxID=290746 RepID=A0A914D7J8_9BILA